MRLLVPEIKPAVVVDCRDKMPIGMYRLRHPSTNPGSHDRDRDRGRGYIESPATLEKAFAEALERTKARLDEQREEIRQAGETRRAATSGRGSQKQRGSSRPRT
jgi:hypothetical protein